MRDVLQKQTSLCARAASGIALLSLCLAAHAQTRIQIATGAQYSSGEYGDVSNTRALVVPFYLRMSSGSWSVQAALPFVSVSGPQSITELLDDNGGLGSSGGSGGASGDDSAESGSGGDDDDPTTPPPPAIARRSASGLGDASITTSYSFNRIGDSPLYVDLRGRVRFPTGSRSEGLGTGATDFAALTEIGVESRVGGLFVTGGRRFLGRVAGIDRVDGWQAGAGAWWNATPHATLGINFDWRDASTTGGIAPQFAEVYAAWRLNDVWKLEVNGGTGLSDASADYALGFTLSWRSAH